MSLRNKHLFFYEFFGNKSIYKNMTYEKYLENCLLTEREKTSRLSDALLQYYNHCKNNHQINGINETAKKLIKSVRKVNMSDKLKTIQEIKIIKIRNCGECPYHRYLNYNNTGE